jgi:hypothetical protein
MTVFHVEVASFSLRVERNLCQVVPTAINLRELLSFFLAIWQDVVQKKKFRDSTQRTVMLFPNTTIETQ